MTEPFTTAGNEEADRPVRRGKGLSLLALFLALAAFSGTGWLWWQGWSESRGEAKQNADQLDRLNQRLQKLEVRSEGVESRISALAAEDPAERVRALERALGGLKVSEEDRQSLQQESATRIRSLQMAIEEVLSRVSIAESGLAALSARNRDSSAELNLAEVDYLLRLAQERLQLFADARTADQALEIADRHIAALDSPMYIGLREQIASARHQLSALNPPDYQALNQQLDLLQNNLMSLTFKGDVAAAQPPVGDLDSSWWTRIRNAFSGLITVHRSTTEENDFPVLADQELIRQRAWLTLEVARLAVLRRDQEAYAAALNRFAAILERWFESSSQTVQGVVTILHELQLLNIAPQVPDISAPWEALQALRGSNISGSVRPAPVPQTKGQQEPPIEPEGGRDPSAEEMSAGDAAR